MQSQPKGITLKMRRACTYNATTKRLKFAAAIYNVRTNVYLLFTYATLCKYNIVVSTRRTKY